MDKVLEIIKNGRLDYKQKHHILACTAENSVDYVNISSKDKEYMEKGIICDLNEGHAPYRPRYILVDFIKYINKGSEYLEIEPPKDMYEAINALLIIYQHIPSVTSMPVYLGDIDRVLEPFVDTVSEMELHSLLKMFLINIDRTLPDAFVHMDIGPKDTKVGRLVLQIERELKKAIPNISFKYSKEETPEDYLKLAIETSLEIGKPYIVNHDILKEELGENYAIASCYNSLKIGGGSFSLVRTNLKKAAEISKDYNDFLDNVLPDVTESMCHILNSRIKFLVEEVKYFETSFLSVEGLINIDNFTAMAGMFGLYECVEILSNGLKLGKDERAEVMGEEILKKMRSIIKNYNIAYCNGYDGKLGFHAQSGIDSDVDVTAGVRIKIGEEPNIYKQIKTESKFHKYFDTGVSDIYVFDKTAKNNVEGVMTITKGALKNGIRVFALNTSDSELIRITGYLVKRSDIEKWEKGKQIREDTVPFGGEAIKKNRVLKRKIRTLEN